MMRKHRTYTLETGVKSDSIAVFNGGKGAIDVLYQRTIVVSKRGRVVKLRMQGWDTQSTRLVMNTALRELTEYHLQRVDGRTYLVCNITGASKPFREGMQITLCAA